MTGLMDVRRVVVDAGRPPRRRPPRPAAVLRVALRRGTVGRDPVGPGTPGVGLPSSRWGAPHRRVTLLAAIVTAASVVVGAFGCRHLPTAGATASTCARARLAREWQTAQREPFVGCWQGSPLPGPIELTDLPAEVGDFADEPPAFVIGGSAVVERPTHQAWELLGPGLLRLTWSAGFDGLSACVEPHGDDRLVGELRMVTATSPLPSSPRPIELLRVACADR